MKKIKKLSLNKEVISSLQEKQMKSLMGGEVESSKGKSSNLSCGGNSCAICPDSVYKCTKSVDEELTPASCCKNSCN